MPRTISSPTGDRVLVIGDDTRAFLATVRSLHRKGCEVHALPFDAAAPALSSRAIRHVHDMAPPAGRERAWAEDLARLARRHAFDLIVPCCERSLIPIAAHRELFAGLTISFPGEAALAHSLDKARFHELAGELGIPVAPGRRLEAGRETAAGLMAELGLPLVFREVSSYAPGRLDMRGQTVIARDRAALDTFLASVKPGQSWHVTAYFPRRDGKAGKGQGVGVSVLADRGEVLLAFQHARLREPDNGGGSSARIAEPLDAGLLAHVRRMCEALRLHGLAMFEFRRDVASGESILIELNARPWGSMPLAIRAGVDFPALLHELLVRGRRPRQPDYRTGVVMRNLVLNLYDVHMRSSLPATRRIGETLAIARDLSLAILLPERTANGFDTICPWDMTPAWMEIVRLGHMYRKRRRALQVAHRR
ncbi:MAG TPA: hypothetical protein ENK13_00210, partial [Thermopetrobacter sp.]|nr:hypothetical protein [Thermopetrobacter sp.]